MQALSIALQSLERNLNVRQLIDAATYVEISNWVIVGASRDGGLHGCAEDQCQPAIGRYTLRMAPESRPEVSLCIAWCGFRLNGSMRRASSGRFATRAGRTTRTVTR